MIRVRPARPDDVPAMSAVLTASITELCAADHRNDPAILTRWLHNKTPEMVARMLANPRARFFVAEHEGEIAAVGCINDPDEIGLNYVSPRHRFRGASKALLAEMEAGIRSNGIANARLSSTGTARQFYRATGWHETGPGTADEGICGMICYPMEKRLV